MKISEEGKSLIKKFEGCKLEAYLCAAGVPTIAWGRTKDVKMGDTCTQEEADAWLDEELEEYEAYGYKQKDIEYVTGPFNETTEEHLDGLEQELVNLRKNQADEGELNLGKLKKKSKEAKR